MALDGDTHNASNVWTSPSVKGMMPLSWLLSKSLITLIQMKTSKLIGRLSLLRIGRDDPETKSNIPLQLERKKKSLHTGHRCAPSLSLYTSTQIYLRKKKTSNGCRFTTYTEMRSIKKSSQQFKEISEEDLYIHKHMRIYIVYSYYRCSSFPIIAFYLLLHQKQAN